MSRGPLSPAPLRTGPGPRSGHAGLAVEVGLAMGFVLCADLLLAAPLPGLVSGRGWAWPPRDRALGAALGPLLSPAHPTAWWPPAERRHLAGPAAYWASLGALVGSEVSLTTAVGARWGRRRRRSSPAPKPARPWPRAGGRARPAWPGGLGHRVPPDRRNRYGLASSSQLRREASVAAARRRAAQTRPSLPASRWPRHVVAAREVGYPLGRLEGTGARLWAHWEASLRLVAPPGEGKTFRALAPILRQHPGPAVATSTKADLFELTAMARGRVGPVVALDPDGLVPAAAPVRWSPVSGCEGTEVAERRAAALVAAAGEDGGTQNSGFFRDSARDLLKAYLHAAALAGLDIRAVLGWSRRPDDTTPADVLASSSLSAPGWEDLVELHTTGAAETTSGVLRYVGRALACFSHGSVIGSCCPHPGEETDIDGLLRGNGTVYLLGKASRLGAVAPLITAFADEVFDRAERLAAAMPARRLDPPLLGLLDEVPSIAPLPSLPELLADGRGRGLVLVYAMQSFSQAVTRWGDKRAETMANATSVTAVLGGLTSAGDLAELERLCGQRRARRVALQRGGGRGRDATTVSWEVEPVLRADQVRTLPAGVALVLWGRLPPLLARMPLMSEAADWPVVEQEERALRRANDDARSLARLPVAAAGLEEAL